MTTSSGTERTYSHVSVVKTLQNDPVNETPEGHIWFIEGCHRNGDDYRVMADDGGIIGIPTETVTVIELPKSMTKREAIEKAREQLKEVVSLAEKYEVSAGGDR